MSQLMFPFASSISLARSKQPADVELRAVARTTGAATVTTASPVDLGFRTEWSAPPPRAERVVAAVASGRLASAFPNGAIRRAPSASRVVVIASSLFLTNPLARAVASQPSDSKADDPLRALAQAYARDHISNAVLSLKHTLDWFSSDEGLVACMPLDIADGSDANQRRAPVGVAR
jgi:hypothetical protein